VGARTKLKQDDIIEQMSHLKRSITFGDLSRRWAVDRHYGASIEWVANGYRAVYCRPGPQRADAAPARSEDAASAEAQPVVETADAIDTAPTADAPPATDAVESSVPTPTQTALADNAPAMPAPKPERTLPPAEALGGPPAPPEVATAPSTDAETAPPMVVAAAMPEPAPAPTQLAIATPEPKAVTTAPVRTIWSRDKTDAPAAEAVTGAEATGPTAAAPAAKAKQAQRMDPVPLPKSKLILGAETPFPPHHVPEEMPVEEPKAADAAASATAAIETTPSAQKAPEPTLRGFAFAPAVNLADLHKAAPPKSDAVPACRVLTASYGGKKTLLVRTTAGPNVHYTALTVLEGFEGSMLNNFLKAHAPGGSSLGEFDNKDAALAKARELCPGSAAAPKGEGASAG
jgi:hypothetical protein